MEAIKTAWDFFQNEILGMRWLNRLIGTVLKACGLDTAGRIGGSIQFFIYDTIKIMVLLGILILIIAYIQSYFPPERTKKNTWPVSRDLGKYTCRLTRNGHTVLFLLVDSVVYWLHKRRAIAGSNLLFPDFFSDGRLGKPCTVDEYFRVEGRFRVCDTWTGHCSCRRYAD